jgi:hypothetical protein
MEVLSELAARRNGEAIDRRLDRWGQTELVVFMTSVPLSCRSG